MVNFARSLISRKFRVAASEELPVVLCRTATICESITSLYEPFKTRSSKELSTLPESKYSSAIVLAERQWNS